MLMIATFALNAVFNLLIGILMAKFLGPADFGRYALAQSAGIVFNTIFIDWLRHSVTRFYREGSPGADIVRATLELTLAVSAVAICIVAAIGILAGVDLGLGIGLAMIAPVVGLTNGLFDFSSAMFRAGFKNKPYAQAIIIKNILSIVLMVAGAALFHSAILALAGLCLSIMAALLSVRQSLRRPETATRARPSLGQVRLFALYAWPIVIANVLIQAIPLFNRTLLSQTAGFDATGQYSLAYDLGIRVVAAIGSSVDILLLQLAIRADHEHGHAAAKAQLARNMGIVFAIMTPVCLGLWMVLPSFAVLFVPDAFRQPFVAIFEASLPGFFAFALLFFALHQVFFVAHRTWPLVFTALAALIINVVSIMATGTQDPVAMSLWQGLGMFAGLGVGAAFIARLFPVAPSKRDVLSTLIGATLMAGSTYWLRQWTPGAGTLIATSLMGAAIYGATMLACNTAGCRSKLRLGI